MDTFRRASIFTGGPALDVHYARNRTISHPLSQRALLFSARLSS